MFAHNGPCILKVTHRGAEPAAKCDVCDCIVFVVMDADFFALLG